MLIEEIINNPDAVKIEKEIMFQLYSEKQGELLSGYKKLQDENNPYAERFKLTLETLIYPMKDYTGDDVPFAVSQFVEECKDELSENFGKTVLKTVEQKMEPMNVNISFDKDLVIQSCTHLLNDEDTAKNVIAKFIATHIVDKVVMEIHEDKYTMLCPGDLYILESGSEYLVTGKIFLAKPNVTV